ncbi:hypothetical protein KM043_005214 [Ampulex compressa]|nr:hypothetical protein KM043_005214 [Ampulex compressa]
MSWAASTCGAWVRRCRNVPPAPYTPPSRIPSHSLALQHPLIHELSAILAIRQGLILPPPLFCPRMAILERFIVSRHRLRTDLAIREARTSAVTTEFRLA